VLLNTPAQPLQVEGQVGDRPLAGHPERVREEERVEGDVGQADGEEAVDAAGALPLVVRPIGLPASVVDDLLSKAVARLA
jgi:hypothetical protein